MAMRTLLDIVSAEQKIFSGPVEMVVVTAELGELGVVPGHAPLLTVLRPGEIRVKHSEGNEELFYVSGGFLEVQPDTVSILADTVLRADDVDEAAAMEAKAQAEEAMSKQNTDIDYSTAAAELARAAAQIRLIQKLRKQKH